MRPLKDTEDRIKGAFIEAGHDEPLLVYVEIVRALMIQTSVPGTDPLWEEVHRAINKDPNVMSIIIRPKSTDMTSVHPLFQQAINDVFNAGANGSNVQQPAEQLGQYIDQMAQENMQKWMESLALEHLERQEESTRLTKDNLMNLDIILKTAKSSKEIIDSM